jgi:hypothetical protein
LWDRASKQYFNEALLDALEEFSGWQRTGRQYDI